MTNVRSDVRKNPLYPPTIWHMYTVGKDDEQRVNASSKSSDIPYERQIHSWLPCGVARPLSSLLSPPLLSRVPTGNGAAGPRKASENARHDGRDSPIPQATLQGRFDKKPNSLGVVENKHVRATPGNTLCLKQSLCGNPLTQIVADPRLQRKGRMRRSLFPPGAKWPDETRSVRQYKCSATCDPEDDATEAMPTMNHGCLGSCRRFLPVWGLLRWPHPLRLAGPAAPLCLPTPPAPEPELAHCADPCGAQNRRRVRQNQVRVLSVCWHVVH